MRPLVRAPEGSWFNWFQRHGLKELFDEINPIVGGAGGRYQLRFIDYSFGDPTFIEEECRARGLTYLSPLRINTRLTDSGAEEWFEGIWEKQVLMGHVPIMTAEGTFIIEGVERQVDDDPEMGVLLQDHCRKGMRRMAEVIVERMQACDPDTVTAARLIRSRSLAATVVEFVVAVAATGVLAPATSAAAAV